MMAGASAFFQPQKLYVFFRCPSISPSILHYSIILLHSILLLSSCLHYINILTSTFLLHYITHTVNSQYLIYGIIPQYFLALQYFLSYHTAALKVQWLSYIRQGSCRNKKPPGYKYPFAFNRESYLYPDGLYIFI